MSFLLLAPLALAGALMISVPILLHLIDRRRVPRIEFPALRFLMAAQKTVRRRCRVRDPWLLALRILALLLLVLAFSRPQLTYRTQSPPGADLSDNVIFLLDNSMSMSLRSGAQSLLEKAKERADEVIDRLSPSGRAGLIVFNSAPEDRTGGASPDLESVRSQLEKVAPTYEESNLKRAVLAGMRGLLATPEGGGDLYLLSDLTQASLQNDSALRLPPEVKGKVRLIVANLGTAATQDLALLGANATREGGEGGNIKITARVRAQGEQNASDTPLDLRLNDDAVARGYVAAKSGETVEKVFSLPSSTDPAGRAEIRLGDDALNEDNRYYFRLLDRRHLQVLVVDGAPGENLTSAESFFVERALNPRRASGSRLVPVVTGEGGVRAFDPQEYAVVFLLNVADPSALAEPLRHYVERGGGLLIAMGDRVQLEIYNRTLGDLLPASLGEAIAASPEITGEQPPALAWPEVSHPIFRVFREAGASGFSRVSFYQFLPTAPTMKKNSEVLLKYTNGLPALLSRTVGLGRVLLFTSSLDHDWNDFPLKSIFLPFIQECAHFLARNPTGEDQTRLYTVGQRVTVEGLAGDLTWSVRAPDGSEYPLEITHDASEKENETRQRAIYRNTQLPGHYEVLEKSDRRSPAKVRDDLAFAVNVSPLEMDLTPFQAVDLQKHLDGIPVVIEGQTDEGGTIEVERERTIHHELLWGVLLFLLLEPLWMLIRREKAVPEASLSDLKDLEPVSEPPN